MTKALWNCGACGQYYDLSERDLEGFHDSNKCDANDEEPKLVAFDKWLKNKETN